MIHKMGKIFMIHRLAYVISFSALVLFAPHAAATNQAEDATVTLSGNTLTVHANQTLIGSVPGQYSVKNLFDADPTKAWVFHGEEQYPKAEQIKNPGVLTLTLSHPSALFAIILTPGYNKSASTQFQNASPRSILVSLYRQNDDKPFEKRLFVLNYHAREYSLPALQKELKTITFVDQTDDRITGKSDNQINSAERMLLINHSGAQITKIELNIPTIEHGAKFTDVAISKLRLLDGQADQNTPEYKLAQFIRNDFNHAVHELTEAPRCIVYTAQNPWPLLQNRTCTAPAPKVQLGGADQGMDDVILTRQDPTSHEYQIPFQIALRDAMSTTSGKKRSLSVSGDEVATKEIILDKSAAGQFRALSGLALTQVFLANRQDGLNKAYMQTQDDPYFFFAYSRLQFTTNNDGYQIDIYGPVGNQEVKWTTK